MPNFVQRLQTEELRAFCECPAKFQVLDFTGSALGTYFALDGLRRFNTKGEKTFAAISIFLGGWMVWIHTRRFVFGSQLGTRFEGRDK